jgi:hypothetical protein
MVKILKSYTRQSVAKLNPHIQKQQNPKNKMLYYYDKQGNKIGPTDIETLKKLAESKKINPETIITNKKGKKWKASEMSELKFNKLEFFIINTLRKMAKPPKRFVDDKTLLEKYANHETKLSIETKTSNETKTPNEAKIPIKKNTYQKNKTIIENKTKIKIRHDIDLNRIALNILIFATIILLLFTIIAIIHTQLFL